MTIVTRTLACSFAIATSALAPALSAQVDGRGITVTGEAEVKVAPDQIIVSLGVETTAALVQDSKTANDARLKGILDALARLGVDSKQIQTDYLSIEPEYRNRFEATESVRYVVRRAIAVDLRNIALFESLLRSALDAGATHVHGVQFKTTQLRQHRDQARLLAIRAAKERATLLARALDRGVGTPNSVYEDHGGWWSSYGSWSGGRYNSMAQNIVQEGGGSPVSIDALTAPGQISVTARVTVSFSFQ